MMDGNTEGKRRNRLLAPVALAAVAAAVLAAWAPTAAASQVVCHEGQCYCSWGSSWRPCGTPRDFGAEQSCNRLTGGYYVDSGAAGPFLRRVKVAPGPADYVPPFPEVHEGLPCPHTASEMHDFCYEQYHYRPLATDVADDVFATPDHPVQFVGYYSAPVRRAACDEVPWMSADCGATWYVDWEWQPHAGAGCYVRGDSGAPVRDCWQGASIDPAWYAYSRKCSDQVVRTG